MRMSTERVAFFMIVIGAAVGFIVGLGIAAGVVEPSLTYSPAQAAQVHAAVNEFVASNHTSMDGQQALDLTRSLFGFSPSTVETAVIALGVAFAGAVLAALVSVIAAYPLSRALSPKASRVPARPVPSRTFSQGFSSPFASSHFQAPVAYRHI